MSFLNVKAGSASVCAPPSAPVFGPGGKSDG
jgi:hypothetical protein